MVTTTPPGRQSGCPISFSLDIFGDRWTLLVLRDLFINGKRRFQELRASDEKIASNILADRLRRLEADGIIVKARDPEDGRKFLYTGTDKGMALLPVLLEIAAWGAVHDPDTAAPPDFAARFFADREGVTAEYRERLEGAAED